MSVDKARDFLESLGTALGTTGGTQTGGNGVAGIRLATIDPAYTSGLAKVTFDGEEKVNSKGYAWVMSYSPKASDRVYLIPVGTSYLIGGAVRTTNDEFITHRRAEFTTTNWYIDPQPWDTGPVTLDTSPTKTKNNDFCTAGPFAGSISFTKSGYYSVSCLFVSLGSPGSGWLKLNHSVDGLQGMDSIIANHKHEGYVCLPPTYFASGTYIRSSISVSLANNGNTRWKVVADTSI